MIKGSDIPGRGWKGKLSALVCCALAPLVCIAALKAAAPRGEGPPHCRLAVGDRIPPEALERLRPEIERLGGPPFMAGFFLTWAPTYDASINALNQARAAGMAVIGITPSRKTESAAPAFPIIEDAEQNLARAFGVEVYPTFIIVAEDGRIIAVAHHLPTLYGRMQGK